MDLTKLLLVAGVIASSTAIYSPCLAKRSTICKTLNYLKRTAYIAAPPVLTKFTNDYLLRNYAPDWRLNPQNNTKDFVLYQLMFGAYAAYFWQKALQQKLKVN